ncbi:IS3 family transposase [Dyadobacter sandarakinus]|uniref:IS3 family transposase n=1 Tax=Dyadobacter sandarakinus TaxID=2747268 RepID=A0ABX7I9P6_9BACT|nr:IS3 family transposase [Dyadobacter sandarakinus]QRR02836.1 IS3 family transposase [Dyadobacter sandarakinus]
MLQILKIPRSSFYYHLQTKSVPGKHEDAKRQSRTIRTIYHQHKGRLGYRRITLAMKNTGTCINHKTVLKLMKQSGLRPLIRTRKYCSYKGKTGRVAPNVLKRAFHSQRPGQKWATNVIEFKVKDQKLYLSPIIGLFNGEIVSYNLSQSPTSSRWPICSKPRSGN